jgi:hypothetical protein
MAWEKIKSGIRRTEVVPWIRQHWLSFTIMVILAFFQLPILGIIFLFGLVATVSVEMLKAMIQAEVTILGFFALVAVYALSSLDGKIDRLEQQIFKIEEKYLDFSNNPESIKKVGETKISKLSEHLNKVKKTKRRTVYLALYAGVLLIGSLFTSILGLGFLGIPNKEWAFYLCSISTLLFFFGTGIILLIVYDFA